MKVYKVIVDAMVTIHPMVELNVFAKDEATAKKIAKDSFIKELNEEHGWIDYDEINIDSSFIRELDNYSVGERK